MNRCKATARRRHIRLTINALKLRNRPVMPNGGREKMSDGTTGNFTSRWHKFAAEVAGTLKPFKILPRIHHPVS